MSYRICYDNRTKKYEVKNNHILSSVFYAAVGVLLAVGLCTSSALRSWIIPGEDAVTVQAFSSMTDDLRSGAGLWEALEGFCGTVIHGR